jgi:hypothetical protein
MIRLSKQEKKKKTKKSQRIAMTINRPRKSNTYFNPFDLYIIISSSSSICSQMVFPLEIYSSLTGYIRIEIIMRQIKTTK